MSARRRQSSAATADALGLVETTSYARLTALCSHAFLTVAFLVWINVSSPFVLSSLLADELPPDAIGSATSRLLLADELTALSLYLPVGLVSDSPRWGLERSAVLGYIIVAGALLAYVRVPSLEWLVAARVLFAVGGSTLVTTMSTLLLRMSAIPDEVVYGSTSPPLVPPQETFAETATETSHLVSRRGGLQTSAKKLRKSSRSAGVLAFASGLGAVVAVFGFLRLPLLFARLDGASDPDSPGALRFGLRATFHFLAVIALVQAVFLAFTLPGATAESLESDAPLSVTAVMREAAAKLIEGFRLGAKDGNIALGFASSFASRAQTTVTNAFLPLLIERYFTKYHLCDASFDQVLPDGGQRSCRRAYLLASALTGVVQLLSLVLSPIVGFIASSELLSRRTRHPQACSLGIACAVGAAAFLGFSRLPGDGDPRTPLTWVAASGISVAQAAGVVLSLALITTGRGIVSAEQDRPEVAGALSGAYSLSGGLGILVVGGAAGFGFDRWAGAPFALMALVHLAVTAGSAVLYRRS